MRLNKRSENGVVSVEMAVLLPFIMLMVLGAVDLGRLFRDSIAVSGAARAGLAYGSLGEEQAELSSEIISRGQKDVELVSGINISSVNVCECNNGNVVDCASGTCTEGGPKLYVKVTAQKQFSPLIPYPGIPSPVTLRRVNYMRAR